MCFVQLLEQTAIISLHKINGFALVLETLCPSEKKKTEILNTVLINFGF